MNGIEREYEYRPKWTLIVYISLFFGLCAAVLGAKAARNDRGLIINGIIELGPDAATAFYWVLCVCSAGFVAVGAFLVYHRLTFRQRLAFGPSAFTVPVSRWSREQNEIAYRDISTLATAQIGRQWFLYVTHPGGRYTIAALMLPFKATFDEVCELLTDRVRGWHMAENWLAERDTAADRPRDW